MKMRNFTKLLTLFVLCLIGMQGYAQNVTIRANNGSMIASVPDGNYTDPFYASGGFATWQHEQLSMVLTASDMTRLTSSNQLDNPANNLYSDGTHIQIAKGRDTYRVCYVSLSLPKGYRFTKYTIVFSKPNELTKTLNGNSTTFNSSNTASRFGETNSSFEYIGTAYRKDVARGGAAQTITRTADDMSNVLYFRFQNTNANVREIITLESAEFEFTAEADYAPLTTPGTASRVSAIDIPFQTSKVDYGTITSRNYGGATRVSYSSANVKDLQANFTLYEAEAVKDGTDFDGTSGNVVDYKKGSISVENGYYRIGAEDASKPGTTEHVYYIETPSYVLLSDNVTKNPVGYRIVGAKIDYKYGSTKIYGTEHSEHDAFYISQGSYYLNSTGGATTSTNNRALWFIDDEGYIRTGANGTIYLSNYNSQTGGSGYAGTTQNKEDAVKFSISNEGYIYYTENGTNYWMRRTTSWGTSYFRFQNNTGNRATRTLTGGTIKVDIDDDVMGSTTQPYTLKVYDKTGTSAQTVNVSSSNASGSVYVAGMNNDAIKIGVIGTGLIQGTLTLQALDPYLDRMKVVCSDPEVEPDLHISQNFTASDFSVNGGKFYFYLPTECDEHDVTISFEDLSSKYLDETYTGGSSDNNSRINFVQSLHYQAFGTTTNNIYSNTAEAANAQLERQKVSVVGTEKFKFNNAADLSSGNGILTEYPFTLANYAAAPNEGTFSTMTFTVSSEDQDLTRYVFTTDETRYNIAPTTAIQHRAYAFYEMEVHVQSSTYDPKVEFVKVYENTDYDNSEDGGSIDQNDAFYGAVVTIDDQVDEGYASIGAIYNAINDAIEEANGVDAPTSPKQLLYLDFSELAGVLQTTTGTHQTIGDLIDTYAKNCLFFLPVGSSAPNNNVAYKTQSKTFEAANNIVLTDKQPFFSPYDIYVRSTNYATYTRKITRPENGVVTKATLIMPFALSIANGVHTNADGKSSFSLNTMKDGQNFSQAPSSVDHPSAKFEKISGEWSEANKPYTVEVLTCEEEGDDLSFVVTQNAAHIVATPKETSGLGKIALLGETASGQYTNKNKVTTSYTCTNQGSFAGITYDRAKSENVFYFASNMFLNLHTLNPSKQYMYNYPFRAAYIYPDGGTGSNLLRFFDIDFQGTLGDTDAIAEMPQQADLAVRTGNGYISMTSTIDQTVSVRSLNGTTVGELNMRAGDSKSINLPSGIYVVNNVKIIVK